METATGTARRTFLKTVGAGALAGLSVTGAATGTATAATTSDKEFLSTDGTQFTVGGQPIYFSGSNNFWIMDPYADRSLVDRLFQFYDDLGINLVRTWAFCSGGSGPKCLQPNPGEYNEAGLEHLDYVIHRAKQHGIRLVLPFTDNWTYYGGIDQYVDWVDSASDHADFYTNQECRRLYRNYVETLLTRTNSITGVEYRNDPTIGIWELANEPRAKADPQGLSKLTTWIEDMSSFIKGIDGNHLVSTGMEGFYAKNPDGDWRHDGSHGTAYIDQHQIDTIDACSFHLYPHHWPGLTAEEGADWITEHLVDAHETVGKPGYCGEFGVHDGSFSATRRKELYSLWFDTFDQYDANADLAWQLRISDSDDDGFAIARGTDQAIIDDVVVPYTDTVYEKSGGNGSSNGPPYADAASPSSVSVGETATFDASWSFDPERSLSSYEWSFGDGASGSGQTAPHRYDEPGTYDVSVTVSDGQGATASDTETIDVTGLEEGTVLLEGAGEKVHRDVVGFHYAYTQMSGDFTVTAKVADIEAITAESGAGIMLRSSLETPAAMAATAISPGDGARFLRSYDTDSPVWRGRPQQGRSPPAWVRLERSGGTAHASISTDGSTWTEFDSGQISVPDQVYVGLYVTSHSTGDLCSARFSEASWLENWQSTDVGTVQLAGNTTAGSGNSGGDDPTVEPINEIMPRNVDADATYEDFNDNGNVDFDDVVVYSNHRTDPVMTDHTAAYDYNGNDDLDFADIVELFGETQ